MSIPFSFSFHLFATFVNKHNGETNKRLASASDSKDDPSTKGKVLNKIFMASSLTVDLLTKNVFDCR